MLVQKVIFFSFTNAQTGNLLDQLSENIVISILNNLFKFLFVNLETVWLKSVPWGLRKLLEYIDEKWDSKKFPIFITENGLSSRGNGTVL